MEIVEIKPPYITLGQFLKFVGIIQNGGDIKTFLNTNQILVNNSTETRRGRKLYKNDLIKYQNKTYMINERD